MSKPWRLGTGALVLGALLSACEDDTNGVGPESMETSFEVRVENISAVYEFTSSGVFNTPVGADAPGPLPAGEAYDFDFYAGPGSRVSFATMFVQSNDLFYAPDGEGIEVYDAGGMPLSGAITDQVYLWDAGTEVNQEPGLGADQAPSQAGAGTEVNERPGIGLNQAPRQPGRNTGVAEGGVVRQVNDGYAYPDVNEVIRVTLTPISTS